jgi:outer membrane scaffolding protein for murein synthesis (MipA/OmpV family)
MTARRFALAWFAPASLLACGCASLHPSATLDTVEPAAAEALVPLPSVYDFTRGAGWGVALGLGVEYESAYDGSDEYEVEVEPAGAVHWRRGNHMLFWEGFELGWRARLAEDWLVQANGRREGGRESDDSDDGRLDGLEDQDDEIVGVIEVRRGLGEDWRAWLAGRVMAGGSDFGLLGVLAAGYRLGEQLDGTGTEAFVFSTFGDDDFVNKDFGVTAAEAVSSGLAETDLDGGYRSTGLTLLHRRYLTRNLHLALQAGLELYSGEIQGSPIAREDFEAEIGLSILYHF